MERRVEAKDRDAGHQPRLGEAADVAVEARARQLAEQRWLGRDDLATIPTMGDEGGEPDAELNPEEEREEEGGEPATASARLTRQSVSTRRTSKRLLTAAKTIDASTALGIGLKAGVRSSSVSMTSSIVKTPCIGVHSAPHDDATSAERESEPEAGYAAKHAPQTLARPNATSSWFAVDLVLEFHRKRARRETERMKQKVPTTSVGLSSE